MSHTEFANSYSDVIDITASNCCLCRRELTDASSVQNGIGPVCSRKYYSDAYVPTEVEMLRAKGSLAISELPDNVVDAVIAEIDKGNARQACNILVYFASAVYDDREQVFRIAAIVRDFGYTLLADKLETDRTKVTLQKTQNDEGEDVIRMEIAKEPYTLVRQLRNLGADRKQKQGRRYTWEVAFSSENVQKVECLMGMHFGDKLAIVQDGFLGQTSRKVVKVPKKTRYDYRRLQQAVQQAPNSVVTTRSSGTTYTFGNARIVDRGGKTVDFFSPFSSSWLSDMKAQVSYRKRRWNGSCWMFDRSVLQTVKELAETHYGVAG